MPPWNDLATGDLRALVAYLQTLSANEPAPVLKDAEREAAKALYLKQCAVCHGETGGGDGPSASALVPAPTNFQEIQPTTAYAESALLGGVRGTAMPRWEPKLKPEERSLLARYVRTLHGQEKKE